MVRPVLPHLQPGTPPRLLQEEVEHPWAHLLQHLHRQEALVLLSLVPLTDRLEPLVEVCHLLDQPQIDYLYDQAQHPDLSLKLNRV